MPVPLRVFPGLFCLFLAAPCLLTSADDLDEFRIKRKEVFEFTQQPVVTREGDHIEIAFTTKDYCDVTVAVENARGKIVRHLASGVLGSKAPAPFKSNSLSQLIVWDGKDDQGRYIDDKDSHTIRVSLGLKAQFERNLFWEPKKRWSEWHLSMQAAPEGVYVFDNGIGNAQLRLYDHEAQYVKTVYPFPGDKLDEVVGLNRYDYPQLDKKLPLMRGFLQSTFLSSGSGSGVSKEGLGIGTGISSRGPAYSAGSLAVRGKRIALAHWTLNRLSTDGSTGGLPLEGPNVSQIGYVRKSKRGDQPRVGPTSMAFSPDGEKLYMAGYNWTHKSRGSDCLSGVAVMDYARSAVPTTFVGTLEARQRGSKPGEFNCASSVAVDKAGRVYVSDYINDRIQVFTPEGKFLKAIPCRRPAKVEVHPKTQEIYVFSWIFFTIELDRLAAESGKKPNEVENLECKLLKFGPLENPSKLAEWKLPLPSRRAMIGYSGILEGLRNCGAIDGYGEKTYVWLNRGRGDRGGGHHDNFEKQSWEGMGIQVLVEQEGELKPHAHFGQQTVKNVLRAKPPKAFNQQLYVNPANEKVYLHEGDSGTLNKCAQELIEIDPASGNLKKVTLPFSALDLAFDQSNRIYLRTTDVVARFDANTMREIPFSYGEELKRVGSGTYSRSKGLMGGLVMPSGSPVCYQQGGMSVSLKGMLAVACHDRSTVPDGLRHGEEHTTYGTPYKPKFYPGRVSSSTSCCVHIWDEHGEIQHADAIGGLPQLDGVRIDANNNLYVMACPSRIHNGKKYFNDMSSTVIKFQPKQGKILSGSQNAPVPLTGTARPDGEPQLYGGGMKPGWVQGAEWFYGGVGFAGFNAGRAGGGCACWWSRFDIDYYGRTFAPETALYSVAVLDSNGNLILRVGRYGNVDSTGPNSRVPLGGDEVGLVHAKFVATHTDRRLFIADSGNQRIAGVKLGYHHEAQIALKDIPDVGSR